MRFSDCRVYARAAAWIASADRWTEVIWRNLEQQVSLPKNSDEEQAKELEVTWARNELVHFNIRKLLTHLRIAPKAPARPSAPLTPGMLRWLSLWMGLQEMVEDMQQGQDMLLVAASLGLPNIIDNHVPDFFAAVLLGQKVLSERGCSDFGKMFVLCKGEHLLFGQAT